MSGTELEDGFREYQRTGSPEALAMVFDLLAPELLLVAMHMVRNTDAAEELVQNTFLAAIEGAERWDGVRGVRPWMVGILANQARRERKRRRRVVDPERLEGGGEVDPVDAAQAAEFAEVAAGALARLPHRYREVLTLHWVHGLSATQIGQALGRSPATVKTHLHRGRRILLRLLPVGLTAALMALVSVERGLAAVRKVVVGRAEELAVGKGVAAGGVLSGSRLAALFVVVGGAVGMMVAAWPRAEGAPPVVAVEGPPVRLADAGALARSSEGGGRSAVAPQAGAEELVVHVRYGDGSPAAGAWFSVVPLRGVHPLLQERWVETDGGGSARVACPGGAVRLTADRGGVVDTAGREVVLTIPRGVDVEGEVVDGERKPVGGARIWVSRAGVLDEGVAVTASDAGGRFGLRSVEPGRCLSALVQGFEPARLRPVRVEGGRITLVVEKKAVRITGRVQDGAGRPVVGAKVLVGDKLRMDAPHDPERVGAWSPPLWLESDAQGAFASDSLPAEPECYVWTRAPGFSPGFGTILVDAERGADVKVVLQPGVALQGRAVDRSGQGVADAWVVVRDRVLDRPSVDQRGPAWVRSEGWTDGQGSFRLDGLPALSLHVVAHGPGRLSASATLEGHAGEILSWYPILGEVVGMSGRLRDEHGMALSGWRVELQGEPAWEPVAPAKTDAQGRFSFDGCEGGAYRIKCWRPEGEWPEVALNEYPVGAESLELSVPAPMVASARLTGRLVDASGVEGRLGLRVSDGLASCAVVVDPGSGRFATPLLPPGRFRLCVGHGEEAAMMVGPFELGSGTTVDCGEIRLEPPGELRVRLAGPDGTVPEKKEATVSTADGICFRYFPIEKGRGRVRLWPGTWRLDVRYQMSLEGGGVFVVASGGRTDLALTVPPSVTRRVVIAAPDDGEDLRVDWRCESDGRLLSRWQGFWKRNANPVQEVSLAFVPGDYRILLTDQAGRRATAGFTVTAGETGTDPIRLDLR